ncbi:MAG: DUF1858 domain-containing protein [Bacteroidales bacterium]|nr:DUF1858 domain-containing protein [Bacteroidales bacterium]
MISKENKIAYILSKYPFMKEKLIERNKLFANLNNPIVFNTVGKFARLIDVAKVSGEKQDDLVNFINAEIAKAENK